MHCWISGVSRELYTCTPCFQKHPRGLQESLRIEQLVIGKCRLSDLVGADIGLHVGKNFIEAFSDRVYPAQIISLLNDHKRLGEKTGSGFYKFDNK